MNYRVCINIRKVCPQITPRILVKPLSGKYLHKSGLAQLYSIILLLNYKFEIHLIFPLYVNPIYVFEPQLRWLSKGEKSGDLLYLAGAEFETILTTKCLKINSKSSKIEN